MIYFLSFFTLYSPYSWDYSFAIHYEYFTTRIFKGDENWHQHNSKEFAGEFLYAILDICLARGFYTAFKGQKNRGENLDTLTLCPT